MSTTSMLAPSTSSSTCGQSRKVARTSAWNWRYARPLLACGRREYSTSTYSDAEYRFEAEAAVACQAAQGATLDEDGWQLENRVERPRRGPWHVRDPGRSGQIAVRPDQRREAHLQL